MNEESFYAVDDINSQTQCYSSTELKANNSFSRLFIHSVVPSFFHSLVHLFFPFRRLSR